MASNVQKSGSSQGSRSMLHVTPRTCIIKIESPNRPSGNCEIQFSVYNAFKRFFLPTVHAQGVTVADKTTLTSVERLDAARPPKPLVSDKEVTDYIENESGMQRIREMFSKTKTSEYSDDLNLVMQTTRNCGGLVFLLTCVLGGNAARQKFLAKNVHKKYDTKFQAFRAYNDAMFFGSLRFGLKWGLKSALFTGCFMTTSQAISVYRNKTSVLEYAVAGSMTCAMLRLSVGLKGMFAGAVIGSALGAVGGGCICALMYATRATQQQRRYHLIENMLREKKESQALNRNTTVLAESST